MADNLYVLAKKFFGFGDTPGSIKIILPGVPHKRKVSLRCKNYPLYKYAYCPDDIFSAFRVHSLLKSIYGEIVEVHSHDDFKFKPNNNRIFFGGPPTNIFIRNAIKDAPIRYGEDMVNRIIHGTKGSYKIGFSTTDLKSRSIIEDYSLISKCKNNNIIELIISGLRAYGQLATSEFLNEERFYREIDDVLDSDGFEVLVKIPVQGKACVGWEIIEKVRWDSSALEDTLIREKKRKEEYDVFLSYNSEDKIQVKEIAEKLKQRGILPWLDQDDLLPGMDWQETLEKQIRKIKSAIVFFGKHGVSRWQHLEIQAVQRKHVNQKCPVITAILPDCESDPELPLFLEGIQKVDFRNKDNDPIDQLRMGILSAPGPVKESV